MQLTVQPDEGIAPVLEVIRKAKKSIDIAIFRLDLAEVVEALEAAVGRGLAVRALVAHTNRGGEKGLRKLEMRMLASGVTVSRSADELVRYHGKFLIVDGRSLHVHGFNCTRLDVNKSRSFGLTTTQKTAVQEAMKLFQADCDRQPYTTSSARLVVSPENARTRLTDFIDGARKSLLIWDNEVSDPRILRLLESKERQGVDLRILGRITARTSLTAERFPGRRLHVRAMVRDGVRAFVGSQSLRSLELDRRREVGLITTDKAIASRLAEIFEADWVLTPTGKKAAAARDADDDVESLPVAADALAD